MNFQKIFNILEIATESLIKFIKLVLIKFKNEDFSTFLNFLYLTRKELDLKDKFHIFVPYSKCHKLYEKHKVEDFHENKNLVIMKCHHIEFSNLALHHLLSVFILAN